MNLPNLNFPRQRRAFGFPGRQRPWWWGIVAMLIAAGSYYFRHDRTAPQRDPTEARTDRVDPRGSSDDLAALIRAHRSGVVVESSGIVIKTLPDDTAGDQHQRFLVRVNTGETILIAHNIDLATRAPVRQDDPVRFRGEFEWNERGGVVHWTHRDPRHRHADGWIEFQGKRYN